MRTPRSSGGSVSQPMRRSRSACNEPMDRETASSGPFLHPGIFDRTARPDSRCPFPVALASTSRSAICVDRSPTGCFPEAGAEVPAPRSSPPGIEFASTGPPCYLAAIHLGARPSWGGGASGCSGPRQCRGSQRRSQRNSQRVTRQLRDDEHDTISCVIPMCRKTRLASLSAGRRRDRTCHNPRLERSTASQRPPHPRAEGCRARGDAAEQHGRLTGSAGR
jgi:hypothetical protein